MNNILLPTDDDFVEAVARAIARDRLHRDASSAMQQMIGVPLEASEKLEGSFDMIFEKLWQGTSPQDMNQKDAYRNDARAAIAAINLKLLTST